MQRALGRHTMLQGCWRMDRVPNCTTGGGGALSTLELTEVTGAEAESRLAAIWCLLEAHALTSPTLKTRSTNTLMSISLTFKSKCDCELVKTALEATRLPNGGS
jgi:hypothetical protein